MPPFNNGINKNNGNFFGIQSFRSIFADKLEIQNRMETKIALVTGGSRGLGKNMALRLAEQGTDVIITYNTLKEEALTVVQSIEAMGRKAVAIQLDVNKINEIDTFIHKVTEVLQSIWNTSTFDFLINNAGVQVVLAILHRRLTPILLVD